MRQLYKCFAATTYVICTVQCPYFQGSGVESPTEEAAVEAPPAEAAVEAPSAEAAVEAPAAAAAVEDYSLVTEDT